MIDYVSDEVRNRADKKFMSKVEKTVTDFFVALMREFGDIYRFMPGEDLYRWEDEGSLDDMEQAHLHYDELKSNGEPLCRITIPPIVVYRNNKWVE